MFGPRGRIGTRAIVALDLGPRAPLPVGFGLRVLVEDHAVVGLGVPLVARRRLRRFDLGVLLVLARLAAESVVVGGRRDALVEQLGSLVLGGRRVVRHRRFRLRGPRFRGFRMVSGRSMAVIDDHGVVGFRRAVVDVRRRHVLRVDLGGVRAGIDAERVRAAPVNGTLVTRLRVDAPGYRVGGRPVGARGGLVGQLLHRRDLGVLADDLRLAAPSAGLHLGDGRDDLVPVLLALAL